MSLNVKKILKGSLISLAILGMIGGSLNIPNANARRRYRTHRVYRHRARRRVTYKFGYWKHHHYYRYKTGYFRNGRWIRKASRQRNRRTRPRRINRRRIRRSRPRRKTYHFMGHTYYSRKAMAKAILNDDLYDNPDGPVKKHGRRRPVHHVNKAHRRVVTKHTSTTPTTDNNAVNNQSQSDNSNNNTPNPNNPSVIATNINEFKQQTLTDLNNDRQANGLAPLTIDPSLQQFADERAQQLTSNYDHLPTGGINNGEYDENINETKQGHTAIENQDRGDIIPVTNNNGYDMANSQNDNFMNDDAPDWGHRNIILDPSNTKVGIGVSYGKNSSNNIDNHFPYKLAEDFL